MCIWNVRNSGLVMLSCRYTGNNVGNLGCQQIWQSRQLAVLFFKLQRPYRMGRQTMNDKQKVNDLLNQLGSIIGIEGLSLNDDNGCTLGFDSQVINLQYEADEQMLVLFSELGSVQPDQKAVIYEELLTANFYRKQMQDCCLSFCPATQCVVLIRYLSVDGLDFIFFETLLQSFIDIATAWAGKIENTGNADLDSNKPPSFSAGQIIGPGQFV